MAWDDRDHDVIIEHPNRQKSASKTTKAIVIGLLLVSVLLLLLISVGGWGKTTGARSLQVAYVLLYLLCAFLVARWSRGVLPVASALAIILLIFAAVAAPGWYARDNPGFTSTILEPELIGLLCVILIPVQLLLIAFAMRAFGQAWNVEVEYPADKHHGRRGGTVAAV